MNNARRAVIPKSEKISFRQAMIIFLVLTYSASTRFVPRYCASMADQASWLAPLVSLPIFILLVLIMNSIYKKFKTKEKSLMDIMEIVLGKVISKTVALILLILITLLTAFYTRYHVEKIVSTIFVNSNLSIFTWIMIAFVAATLYYGLATLARMSEIILVIALVIFTFFAIAQTPNIMFEHLTPVSYQDIIPVSGAGLGIMTIWIYYVFAFLASDRISQPKSTKSMGIEVSIFLTLATIVLMIITVGVLGTEIISRTPFPYLVASKHIDLFGTIQKVESIAIAMWVIADFVLIAFFCFLALHLIKYIFNLKDVSPITNIYLFFIGTFSLAFVNSLYKLDDLSAYFVVPSNLIIGLGLPVLLFVVGKIRKKI